MASEKKSWERSLGTLGGGKKPALLVRPTARLAAANGTTSSSGANASAANGTAPVGSAASVPAANGTSAGVSASPAPAPAATRSGAVGGGTAVTGLGLLGAYSDSESD